MARSRLKRTKKAFPALEWVLDAAGARLRLTLVGSERLMAENHKGILEFTPHRVRLMTSDGVLSVIGEGLTLNEVRPGVLSVVGRIAAIQMPGEVRPD